MRTTVGNPIKMVGSPGARETFRGGTKREIIMPMAPQINERSLARILSGRAGALDWESFSPADWDSLLRKAQGEGVAPLLYWKLSESGELARLPTALAKALRAAYISTRMHNEGIIREVEMLTHLFEQAGIPTVALKGICFALTVYPDIGLRPMADLDLLVPASKIAEAVRIAKACGYAEAVPEISPGLSDFINHHVCLKKIEAPFTTVELHYNLVAGRSYAYFVPAGWFWSQTESLTGPDRQEGVDGLRMLTPTAQVLYACGHAMLQHGGRNTSLCWIYDLDRLIHFYAERIDWGTLLAQARAFGWASAVEAGLSQARAFFGTPVPRDAVAELRKVTDRNAALVAGLQNRPMSYIQGVFQSLQSLDWYVRFRLAFALATPSPVYMRWRYGLKTYWVLPAWYLYRWWGIFKDALKTVWLFTRKTFTQVSNSGSPLDGSPD